MKQFTLMDAAAPLVTPVIVVLQATLRRPASKQDEHTFIKILRRAAEHESLRGFALAMIKLIYLTPQSRCNVIST